jgi:hypothetical protein
MGKGSGAMVYGIVMYDFAAERPDELDAKAGEAIIVIAQSNPEWFVAKPIGRLGGPGLIPVSFIEIRDMTSGQAVTDAQEAVQRAGVPKVEEWKKMAADYKNSSITLGKFEAANSQQGLEQSLDRMSLQQGARQSQQPNGYVSLHDLIVQQWLIDSATDETIATSQAWPTSSAESLCGKVKLSAICAHICPDTTILLCRGQILVCDRGSAGRWPTLGAVPVLRRFL